ncbi:MAG TPA: ThiF family adenylyltransferase [Thermoplasmata archaeon]|nr:ThiF family adenylyltransferase [Thermoplasmata archaeon]
MLRPRTKRSLSPFRLANGDILLARDVFGLGRRIPYDGSDALWRLLRLMDGSRDLPALTRAVRRTHRGWDDLTTRRALARLEKLGVIEEGAGAVDAGLSPAEADRYSRNLDFFSLVTLGSPLSGVEIQRRLQAARVTILGVGAIGTATAASLAAAGVGHLRLLDPDRVELSNLNRQILYRSGDVGRWKVDAAADHLKAINPHLKVTKQRRFVRSPRELGPLLDGCDLFILGADRPHEILLWANDAAVARGTPWLDNSYSGPRCAIALFVPGRTPCLRCLQHELERRQRAEKVFVGQALFPEPAGNAVIAPTAGIAGHLGALRSLYFLAGLRPEDDGVLVQLNLWTPGDVYVVRPKFWRACPACGPGRPSA